MALNDRIGVSAILRSAVSQINTLKALLVRDVMMRYGREELGFIWLLLEPMMLTVGVLILWSLLKSSYEHGIRVTELVLTGYVLLTLWRHLTNSMPLLFRKAVPLLYHSRVSLLDVFLSRVVVEFLATTAALLVMMAGLGMLGLLQEVWDWGQIIAGWLMMLALGAGAGSIIAVLTERNESLERFINPVQYLLIPISGTFFMVDWFPEGLRYLILVNPLVHCYEIFRSGFIGPSIETHYSVAYVAAWVLVLNWAGLRGIARARADLKIV